MSIASAKSDPSPATDSDRDGNGAAADAPSLAGSTAPTLTPDDLEFADPGAWPTLAAAYVAENADSLHGTLAARDIVTDAGTPPSATPLPPSPTRPARASGKIAGQLIGKYRIGSELGRGGMGAVYTAVHETIGQRAAVKVLFPEFARQRSCEERFFFEARMANLVKHPGLVQVFDHGHLADGTSYLMMELLDGQSLQTRLDHVRHPWRSPLAPPLPPLRRRLLSQFTRSGGSGASSVWLSPAASRPASSSERKLHPVRPPVT